MLLRRKYKREAYISVHSGKLVSAKKPGSFLTLAHDRALKVAVQNSFACNNDLRGSLESKVICVFIQSFLAAEGLPPENLNLGEHEVFGSPKTISQAILQQRCIMHSKWHIPHPYQEEGKRKLD